MIQTTNVQKQDMADLAGCGGKRLPVSGPLPVLMTNDYLFRALLQRNNYVLKGLIGSLFHLPIEEVSSVTVVNPIILGEAIEEKTFFLDIFVILNNHIRINLELQVINECNWTERSLSYLCRTFDNLDSGENYNVVRPAVQIGLLDFTLFPEYPEFYSTYQFMNIKNHTVYSDKMRISVLNLTRKDLATEKDKEFHLHYWASFFKATTWEELEMLAKKDEFINEAVTTIYQLSQEEQIRLQCEAREDYYRRQRTVQDHLDKKNAMIERQNATIENQSIMIENQKAMIESQKTALEGQKATIESQQSMIQNQNAVIENQKNTIRQLAAHVTEQDEEITSLQSELASQKDKVTSLGSASSSQQKELVSLRGEIDSLKELLAGRVESQNS